MFLSKNNLMEFFSEKTELPDVLLSTAQGGILKLEEGAQVLPISDCSNEEINRKSTKLIELAKQTLSGEKQLLQVMSYFCYINEILVYNSFIFKEAYS